MSAEKKGELIAMPAAVLPLPTARAEIAGIRDPYAGAGTLVLTAEDTKALGVEFSPEAHDIRPSGEVYVSHYHVRRRLNEILGVGQWSVVPANAERPYTKDDDEVISYRARLYIRGIFNNEAMGEMRYHGASKRATYASACEGARSDVLSRLGKDLGIGLECWDRAWTEKWKSEYAVLVTVKDGKDLIGQWRRKDAPPFRGEVKNEKAAAPAAPDGTTADVISKEEREELVTMIKKYIPSANREAVAKAIMLEHAGVDNSHNVPKAKLAKLAKAIVSFKPEVK